MQACRAYTIPSLQATNTIDDKSESFQNALIDEKQALQKPSFFLDM